MGTIRVTTITDDCGGHHLHEGGPVKVPIGLWVRYQRAKRVWEKIQNEIQEVIDREGDDNDNPGSSDGAAALQSEGT